MRDNSPFGAPRPKTNGTNGARLENMGTHAVPFSDIEEPIDLVAVQADDELISALAAGVPVSPPGVGGYDVDDRVVAILAAWKAEVDAEPIPELVDVDTAVRAVVAARPRSRRARYLAPVAAAAALVVLAVGGAVGSYDAKPGDTLFPVTKVLYSKHAESLEAVERVEQHISNAKQALAAGQPVRAAQELKQAEVDLADVGPEEEGRTELVAAQDFLEAKADETTPGVPTDPETRLKSDPSRPVPEAVADIAPQPDPVQQPSNVPGTPSPTPADPGPAGPGPVESGPGPVDPAPADSSSSVVTSAPAPAPELAPAPPPEPTAEPSPPPESPGPSDGPSTATPEGQPDPSTPEPAPAQSLGDTSSGGGAEVAPGDTATAAGTGATVTDTTS